MEVEIDRKRKSLLERFIRKSLIFLGSCFRRNDEWGEGKGFTLIPLCFFRNAAREKEEYLTALARLSKNEKEYTLEEVEKKLGL